MLNSISAQGEVNIAQDAVMLQGVGKKLREHSLFIVWNRKFVVKAVFQSDPDTFPIQGKITRYYLN